MKKNLVIGSVLVSTILSAAAPALADKRDLGTLIGGVIGAAAGSQAGKGNGNKAAIAVGAIIGAVVGGRVAENLDQNDRRSYEIAQRDCFESDLGEREWRGNSARGRFRTTQEGYRGNQVCRSYESTVDYGHRIETTSGVACRDDRGYWQNVERTEVNFGSRGGRDSGYGGRDRWDDSRGPYRPGPRPGPGRNDNYRPAPPSRDLSTALVREVTRATGGQWVRVSLRRPVDVSSLEIRNFRADLRIHDVVVHTTIGRPINVNYDRTRYGFSADVRMNEVVAIDVRLESMGGYADVEFTVNARSGRPVVSAEKM